jgi:hypothetical protein
MKHEKRILILLIISLVASIILSYFLRATIAQISKDYIEFLIGLSITMAGFGLVAFQIGKASDELKKDFIESSLIMLLSSLFGIAFWANTQVLWAAILSSFFFLWGIVLLLVILLSERFNIIK